MPRVPPVITAVLPRIANSSARTSSAIRCVLLGSRRNVALRRSRRELRSGHARRLLDRVHELRVDLVVLARGGCCATATAPWWCAERAASGPALRPDPPTVELHRGFRGHLGGAL